MIKLPKDINKALQTIEAAGFPAYAAGEAVRNSLVGRETGRWEIITKAPVEKLEELFPRNLRDQENPSMICVEAGEEEADVLCGRDAEEELQNRCFTVDAMADNPARTFLDPAGGRKDLADKLVRAVGDAKQRFHSDPRAIIRGIALAADLDFDLEMDTFEAMKEAVAGVGTLTPEEIRDAFTEVLVAASPARGLRFSVAVGLMPFVLGEECYPPKTKHEIDDFNALLEKYDVVRQEVDLRWPMLFLCFEPKKAGRAIERLKFDEDSHFKYTTALRKTQELYFVVKPYDFKKFLYQNGWENYEYWENVVKQQRKVYDHTENRIMSRLYMKKEFDQYKMAIYLEDLAVDRNDLLAAGIPEKKVDFLLEKLLYMVHYKPRQNTREVLLKEAKRFSVNPLSRFWRDVHFFR